jgi:hypothetical protein
VGLGFDAWRGKRRMSEVSDRGIYSFNGRWVYSPVPQNGLILGQLTFQGIFNRSLAPVIFSFLERFQSHAQTAFQPHGKNGCRFYRMRTNPEENVLEHGTNGT